MSGPLDKLHDFYQPPPPAWTPQTAGWYVLFAIAGLAILWIAVRSIRRWRANAYRRQALRELALLPCGQFSALLKRTALAAWPREKVSSLSGSEWLQFLDRTTGSDQFSGAPGNRIEEIALREETVPAGDEQALRTMVANWIRRHRVQA
jgi:hypothetical protein